MSKIVLLNTRIFAGSADLTGVSNKVELSSEVEEKDVTTFQPEGSGGWKDVIGGLFATTINASGYWEASTNPHTVDPSSWENLTSRRFQPWSICPESAAAGELAYFTSGLRTSYKIGDAVGEVAPWEAEVSGSAPLLRGVVAHPPGSARTSAGAGTGYELGELGASQRLWASLHVLSVAGTGATLTVSVESAADDTFTDATTRLTFTAASQSDIASRGQFVYAAGPVTDTWWRVTWDVSGTSPSFLFLSAVGIA